MLSQLPWHPLHVSNPAGGPARACIKKWCLLPLCAKKMQVVAFFLLSFPPWLAIGPAHCHACADGAPPHRTIATEMYLLLCNSLWVRGNYVLQAGGCAGCDGWFHDNTTPEDSAIDDERIHVAASRGSSRAINPAHASVRSSKLYSILDCCLHEDVNWIVSAGCMEQRVCTVCL